jgi:hypothetical protein
MSIPVGVGMLTECTVKGIDVRELVSQLDYFESIYSPAASCQITINDASGFHQSAGLKGMEDVSFGFGQREGETIRMKMKAARIGDRMRVKDNQDMYHLNCCPQEFVENNQKSVVKAYKSTKISDMVKEWHNDYVKTTNTSKKDLVTNEETKDQQTYTGVGRSPITAIRWAAKEGFSAKAKASNYVYYQDRDGYHFRTVDSMLQGSEIVTLSYAHQNIGQNGGDATKKIIAFDQKGDFNNVDSSFSGADSDHWYWYDPTTGKIGGGSKRDGAGKTTHTGKDNLTTEQKSERGERFNFVVAPGQSKSKFRDARDPKIAENKRTLPEHGADSSAALQLDNLVMNIRVPGDTKYKAGVKVRLQIPANQEESTLDVRSGTYLITSARHVIYKDKNDTRYECILECKSDSHSKSSSGNSGVAQ